MKLFGSLLLVWFLGTAALAPNAGAVAPPLPSLDLVLQRVMQTSAAENTEFSLFKEHYSFTRQKVTEFFDPSGHLKSREDRLSTNNPVPAPALSRPHPVAPTLTTVSTTRTVTADPPNIHGVALGKKEDLLNPDVVKRFKFTLVGREMLNNRPALLVDFQPVSDSLPVFNLKDRFIDSISGRAWVDEADFTLVKVELHLMNKFTALGGLAGDISKFNFSFVRDRTPDGFWFTHSLDWQIEAREATYQRIVDHHEEIDDLQKIR
jgi:hypothetical protein